LEKHLNEFLECSVEDLVRHGLRALRDTLPNEVELTSKVVCNSFAFKMTM
jgi:20S proteasome subunit alpha 6